MKHKAHLWLAELDKIKPALILSGGIATIVFLAIEISLKSHLPKPLYDWVVGLNAVISIGTVIYFYIVWNRARKELPFNQLRMMMIGSILASLFILRLLSIDSLRGIGTLLIVLMLSISLFSRHRKNQDNSDLISDKDNKMVPMQEIPISTSTWEMSTKKAIFMLIMIILFCLSIPLWIIWRLLYG